MNRITKGITCLSMILLLVFTVFSLVRIRELKRETTVSESLAEPDRELQGPVLKDGKVLLRLANNQGPEHPVSRACDYFAELVRERTGGRIEILNYHSAQLGDEKEVITQVMYGGIDLARISTALLVEYEPELILLQMPYLYDNAEHMWNVLDSEIGDRYLKKLRVAGLEGLCWYDAGARNFYTVEKKIQRAEDLKALKIRVQESTFLADIIRALEAEPVEVPYHKVGVVLKYGEVDGAENNFSSYIGMNHHAYAPYVVVDEHVRIPEVIVMNQMILEQLSEKDQQIICEAARESSLWQRELWGKQEQENIEILKKAGVEITQVENKQEFIERVQIIYETYGKGHEMLFQQIQELKEH